MSNESEISKHLDPNTNNQNSAEAAESSNENGINKQHSVNESNQGTEQSESDNTAVEGRGADGTKDQGTGTKDEGVGGKEQGTRSKDEGEGNREQGVGSKDEGIESKEEGTGSKDAQPTDASAPEDKTTETKSKTANPEPHAPGSMPPASDQPATTEPATSNQQPANSEPATSNQQPATSEPATPIKSLDKPEVVKRIEQLVKEDDPIQAEKAARKLKNRFDTLHKQEREQALKKFEADGNDPDHFAYKFDELDNRFDGAYKLIRDRKYQFVKNLEKNKEKNHADKVALLEELRALVDEEETTSSINAVKQIQQKWKAIGPVPGQHAKTLWANYHALMDLYYDQRSIYFELKELDRKKNLEAKLELCERAEKLVEVENLKQAINELNELHEEFKHIGPVPKEDQQALWDRFKGASDQVYARRKEFIKHLKHDLKKNLVKKQELAEEVQQFNDFQSKRINDWNKKTREILDLQKRWEAVGGLPREHAKEINKKFWGAFKGFFHNKGLFFKELEGERVANLEKKQELVAQAEKLKDSTDWNKTAETLKALQRQWREIGPVPEKHRNSVYQQFKAACDEFFNNLRSQSQESEKEYIENLKQKQKVCVEIETMTASKDYNLDKFLDLKQKFDDLGYVPAAEVKNIRSSFVTASKDFLSGVPEELKEEAKQIKYDIEFEKLKRGPNAGRKIEHKEQALRREIGSLENDIATWKNNLEFFANSKTADKLKQEFTVKIDQAVKRLKELKGQLRAVREL